MVRRPLSQINTDHEVQTDILNLAVPEDLPVWTWLFDSEHSPLTRFPRDSIQGYSESPV